MRRQGLVRILLMREEQAYLFRRLQLRNYKLHRESELSLAHPIVLITGANGSGKTQIIEALKFCLGSHPSMGGKLETCIGPFGREAELDLELSNPSVGSKRVFTSTIEEIARCLDTDTVVLNVRIRPEPSVQYRITGNGTRRVNRADIRDIFAGANIFPSNRLAFTEEGMVDTFARSSPKVKLQILLDATGRRQYLEDLREATEKLRKSEQQTQPLLDKLKWVRSLYQTMAKKMEFIRLKTDLARRHREVRLLRHWAEARDVEQKAEALNSELENLRRRRQRIHEQLSAHRASVEETERTIAEHRRTLSSLQEQIQNCFQERSKLLGRRELCLERMEELESRRKRLLAEMDSIRQGGSRKRTRIDTQRLDQLEEELSAVRARLEEVSALLEDAIRPAEEPLTRFESTLIESSMRFRKALDDSRLSGTVLGPLVSFLRMKPGEEEFEPALRALAGKYLFAFVARDREAYEQAIEAFDRTFSGHRPPITVARPSGARSQRRTKLPRAIHAYAIDLVEGDELALDFLSRILRGAIARSEANANELTDFAEKAGVPVITEDSGRYFLPIGAFTTPPPPLKTSLGSQLSRAGSTSLRALTTEQGELIIRQNELLREIEILRRQRMLSTSEPAHRLDFLEDELRETYLGWERLRRHENELRRRIKELSSVHKDLQKRHQLALDEITKAEMTVEPRRSDLAKLEAKLEQEERILKRFEAEYASLRSQFDQLAETAERLGPRPPEIPPTPDLLREENELKGRLETIAGDDTTEENLKRRHEELLELEKYVGERTWHLEGLREDVQRRAELWKAQLSELITQIGSTVDVLLRGSGFIQVKLEVREVENPNESGLHISARTKVDRWLDYAELSGGERVLLTESIVMALHTLTDSPLHVIDEFTQRLDRSSSKSAFEIVEKTYGIAKRMDERISPQFVVVCPEAFGLITNELFKHYVVMEGKLSES